MSVERQVVRALGSISGATFLSRVLGFVRDMVVALVFGAGPVTDAFFVAFRIPNMLRRLLAEGALSTAVVPVFSEYVETRPREEFVGMVRAVLGAAILALGVTTIVGIVGAPWIIRIIAPGFTGGASLARRRPSLFRRNLLVGPAHAPGHPARGRVRRLLLPAAFGLAAVRVSVFVNTLLASLLPPGSISFLYYAARVMEFPLGVF